MNKKELIDAVAKDAGLTQKDATAAVNSVFENIKKALAKRKADRVQIVGFGTFEVRSRKARTARNPQTGEPIKIKATKIPAFKAGKALKDAVK